MVATVELVEGRESSPSYVGTCSGHLIIPSSFHRGDLELALVTETAGRLEWSKLSSVFSR